MRTRGRDLMISFFDKIRHSRGFSRVRHYRGHGVHSPFVYSLIREVFMKRSLISETGELYDCLRENGADNRTSLHLQNLHSYCNNPDLSVIGKIGSNNGNNGFTEFTIILPEGFTNTLKESLFSQDAMIRTLVIVSHRQRKDIRELVDKMVSESKCLSIDNRGYIIFFYDDKLPVQHFKL